MKVVYRNKEREEGKKAGKLSKITAYVFAGVSAVLAVLLCTFSFIPGKYRIAAVAALAVVNALALATALLPKVPKGAKIAQSALCILLSLVILAADVLAPVYKGRMERMFTDLPDKGTLNINVYVMKGSGIGKISLMMGKVLGVQTSVDREYQEYALNMVNQECSINPPSVKEYEDVYSLAEALYAGEINGMLLNETYVDLLEENADFTDIKTRTKAIFTCEQEVEQNFTPVAVDSITAEPFVVLVGGNDTYSYNLIKYGSHAGRTDVNILSVVNPVTKQILMVTIPRDAYVPFFGDKRKMDKLTHATVYSLDCWKDVVNELLACKVNYFVRINFASLINVVDALGGLTVNNPYYFETTFRDWTEEGYWDYLNYTFPEGEVYLNGHHALAYVRERKYIRNGEAIGDQGRNKHQAIVMKALIEKVTSPSVITKADKLLKAVEGTFATDISIDDVYALVNMQLDDMASWEFIQYNLTGKMVKGTSYAMGSGKGAIFDVCKLDQDKVDKARELIAQMMNGEKISVE